MRKPIEQEKPTIHPLEILFVEKKGSKLADTDALIEAELAVLEETDPKIAKRKMHAINAQHARQCTVLLS